MTLKQRALALTFLQSISTILVARGIYFYTEKFHHFNKVENLLLALVYGLSYAGAAALSHRVSTRIGEKRALMLTLLLQIPVLAMFVTGNIPMLVVGITLSAAFYGMTWPVVESYIVSGDTPGIALKSVGSFNITWSLSNPVALLAAGVLIDLNHWALFAAACCLTLTAVTLARTLPHRPAHLSENHPERPSEKILLSYESLLPASRWLMFCSYSLMWILAAVLPVIFSRLGVEVKYASPLSSIIDVMRAAIFVIFQFWAGWHGRKLPLILVVIGLPLGFGLAMFGTNVPVIVIGEAVFGISAAICYYASLYYAMVVKNAAVEAGGTHESVIGMGFAVGPMLAAAGFWCGTAWHSETLGITAGVLPLILICASSAIRQLLKPIAGRQNT